MGEDISTGTKIGIILIILTALIAIVFSILTIVRNISASATNEIQNSLTGMQGMAMDSYNQKVVTGNDVLSFLQMYRNKDLGMLVSNARFRTDSMSSNTDHIVNYNMVLDCFKDDKAQGGLYHWQNVVRSTYTEEGTRLAPKDFLYSYYLYWDKVGNYYVSSVPKDQNAKLMYNYDTKGLFDKTSPEYINPDHKYRSYLVKNISGDLLGVYFVEDAYSTKKGG